MTAEYRQRWRLPLLCLLALAAAYVWLWQNRPTATPVDPLAGERIDEAPDRAPAAGPARSLDLSFPESVPDGRGSALSALRDAGPTMVNGQGRTADGADIGTSSSATGPGVPVSDRMRLHGDVGAAAKDGDAGIGIGVEVLVD
ncbi:hypothetical protein [Spectribacter hydrogenoxidans]|uniref:Uncharacterized protein n=1 Tax=Spectribacter hydrogenoxidans TaxID=3075608 RepID=A0ABU3BZ50_9GAMM|nr:hypothetical protein [Salinisphaera sp. W335]MDT0634587.1 hypothetical protein [Salinisphaera sp. W335]